LDAPILKIRRINNDSVYLAQKNYINHVDMRKSLNLKFNVKIDVTALCCLNEYSLLYGTVLGEIALFDTRKRMKVWSNTISHSK
jgi:hypothetical protein